MKHIRLIVILFVSSIVCIVVALIVNKYRNDWYNGSYNGIDVSHHQGNINWHTVAKNKKIQFVYLKATEGKTYIDPKYKKNLTQAKAAGFRVGSYHFFRMTSSPAEQFENIRKTIVKSQQDLIPMIDVETTDGYDKKVVQRAVAELCTLVEKHYGKRPIIYSTMRHYNEILAPKFNNYTLYIGRYNKKNPPKINGGGKYDIWQYSENGRIKGIQKRVDLCRLSKHFKTKDLYLH